MAGERLTQDEQQELSAIINAFLPSRGLSLWARHLMDDIEDHAELRALRLSQSEREALAWLRDSAKAEAKFNRRMAERERERITGSAEDAAYRTAHAEKCDRAIAVLDKLLATKEGT